MNAVEGISLSILTIIIMTLMVLTAKYIYCERLFKSKKGWAIYLGIFLILELIFLFFGGTYKEDYMLLLVFFMFPVMIAITREKKRIRGLFLMLPILGICMSPEMIITMALRMVIDVSFDSLYNNNLFLVIFDLIVYSSIVFFMAKKKFYVKEQLGIWERRTLNANGLLLLIIYFMMLSIPNSLSKYEVYFLAGGVTISVMVLVTSTIMTVQSNQANYYKYMAEMNERFLQTQLDYFKSYQATQEETRRIKHDMKNHLLCAWDLFNRGENKILGEYLRELKETTDSIDMEHHIGNEIADAILNEKYQIAKKRGIEIQIDGDMQGINSIRPIDICTIFANALDNAIEGCVQADQTNAIIAITIKKDRNLLFIAFKNPCKEDIYVEKRAVTTKKDVINHGFGIKNMEMTVEKYKGKLTRSIIREDNIQNQFCLEIMLMV